MPMIIVHAQPELEPDVGQIIEKLIQSNKEDDNTEEQISILEYIHIRNKSPLTLIKTAQDFQQSSLCLLKQ